MNPFHLACVSSFAPIKVVQALLQNKANGYAIQKCNGNNVLHMIAGSDNKDLELLKFVAEKLGKIDLFARNIAGDTCMAIAQAKNWTQAADFLDQLAKQNDGTSKVAESLFEELDAEEKKKAAARDKKRRQTLRKAAEKRGITVEELERQNAEAAVAEKKAEIQKEKDNARAEIDEIERRKKAFADFKEQERLELLEEKEAEREAYREL